MKNLAYSARHYGLALCLLLCLLLCLSACKTQEKNTQIKLYAIDCGTLDVADMDAFSDDGKLKGQQAQLVNPCFLIRHPRGDLLWDLGYQQDLAETKEGVLFFQHFRKKMHSKLIAQLSKIGMRPEDVEFISVSHHHDDHVGNANLFAGAHWIAQEAEYATMFSKESQAEASTFDMYAKLATAKTSLFKTEFDVFGDNSVVIRWMPGHTEGSTVLRVQLDHAGTILLTGDLYTHADARVRNSIPSFDANKQAGLRSRAQFEQWAKEEKARVVIQHEKTHFDALPRYPDFLN